jgi:predicted transcriptional regulator
MSKEVITFKKDSSISDVAKTFYERKISGAPVLDNDKTVGMITSADIYGKLNQDLVKLNINVFDPRSVSIGLLQANSNDSLKSVFDGFLNKKVEEMMRGELVSVDPEASLFDATKRMDENNITKLPVIKDDSLLGIITREDIVKAFIE